MKKKTLGRPRNPVAQHMNTFNKPVTMRNKKKDYQRTLKHRKNGFEGSFFYDEYILKV